MRDWINLVEMALRETMQTIEVRGSELRVWKNPVHSLFFKLLTRFGNRMRGSIDTVGDLYVWDPSVAIHNDISDALGLAPLYELLMTSDVIYIEHDYDEEQLRANSALMRAYGNNHFEIENDSAVDDDGSYHYF